MASVLLVFAENVIVSFECSSIIKHIYYQINSYKTKLYEELWEFNTRLGNSIKTLYNTNHK